MLNAIKMMVFFTVILGFAYTFFVTGISQVIFSRKANGSLIKNGDHIVGSELIAQKYTSDTFFHARPSASDFNAVPSGASNLGPTSKALKERMISGGMLTTSASGLDPHLTKNEIIKQFERVATAREFNDEQRNKLKQMIDQLEEGKTLGFMGNKRINVQLLNNRLNQL